MEPPNKGHVGDNINSAVVSFVEKLLGGSKCIRSIGKQIFGTSACVLGREVYYIVSLSRRVPYRRFHCMSLFVVEIPCATSGPQYRWWGADTNPEDEEEGCP